MESHFKTIIVERYKKPRYRGYLDPNDLYSEDDNPQCGDHIRISLCLDEKGVITDARFDGVGCAVSQAAADLLMEFVIGKSLALIRSLGNEEALKMVKMEENSPRVKCAILPLNVLKECLEESI